MTGEVYSATVIEHFRRPRNRRALAQPDISHEGMNPLCGDRLRLQLCLDGDVITEAAFVGDACAISIASASLLTTAIQGGTLSATLALSEEQVIAALGADIRPARRGCAVLPLVVLRAGVEAWKSGRASPIADITSPR